MAGIGTIVNSVTDIASGEVNTRLTPGGAVNLTGSKIKIAGDNPANGISLTNQANNVVTVIAVNSIAVNDPSKITFIVPADLAPGDYKLSITTQFSTPSQGLKDPRSYMFDYILTV